MTTATAETQGPTILVRLPLKQQIVDLFEAQALVLGTSAEELIAAHLERTHLQLADSAPIYLDDVHARQVRELLGGRVSNPDRLVETIRLICLWKIGGWEIPLSPALQEQIHAYVKASGLPVEETAPRLLLEAIRGKFQV